MKDLNPSLFLQMIHLKPTKSTIFYWHLSGVCGFIGPILDDRLKEKILKPWKGAHSSSYLFFYFLILFFLHISYEEKEYICISY